ncbi:MAG: BrnA antitoxin family protein [Steroidobacteraceae bacterium]|nr:BrnA antitoxin family protein [Pseudomonadota bacterium]MBP7609742.1 BrnA antitoxin family protein [Steroidobacteraceae bacterium]
MKLKASKKRRVAVNPEWTKETFDRAKPAADVLPQLFGSTVARRMLKPRGRPRTGKARTSISLRLPPETLARWKATGPGWQTRMAEALDKAIRRKAA